MWQENGAPHGHNWLWLVTLWQSCCGTKLSLNVGFPQGHSLSHCAIPRHLISNGALPASASSTKGRDAAQNHPELQQQNQGGFDDIQKDIPGANSKEKGILLLGFYWAIGWGICHSWKTKQGSDLTGTKNQLQVSIRLRMASKFTQKQKKKKKKGTENSVGNTGRWEAQNPNSVFTAIFHLEKWLHDFPMIFQA